MGKHINKRSGCNCFCHGSKQAYMQALQQSANALYDWVSPKLPEDLTFIKNNFTWFTCTTHEAFGGFSIRSDYYKKLITQIDELKIELVE